MYLLLLQGGAVVALLAFIVVFAVIADNFLSLRNLTNVAVQSSLIAVVAVGMLLVIVTKGIDLSVGSVVALSTVTGSAAFVSYGLSGAGVIFVIVVTGAAFGFANAFVFVKGRVPHPFVVTLASLSIARGLALMLSGGRPVRGMPEVVQWLGSGTLLGIPVPAIVALLVTAALWVLSTRLVWGQWIYAVGANEKAARQIGIPVDRVLMSVYVISGTCAGITGILIAGRTNAGYPTAGNLLELDAIAAVIIGGASFLGGRGSVINALVGAIVITVVRNGLDLIGVNAFAQLLIIGVAVLAAVEIDMLRGSLENRIKAIEARRSA